MEGPFSPEAAVTKGKALVEYPGTAGWEHWCRSSVNPRRQGRWLRSCSLCWPEGCKGPGRKPGTAWKKPSDGKKMQGRDHGFIPALTAMLHHSRLQPSTLLSVHQTLLTCNVPYSGPFCGTKTNFTLFFTPVFILPQQKRDVK